MWAGFAWGLCCSQKWCGKRSGGNPTAGEDQETPLGSGDGAGSVASAVFAVTSSPFNGFIISTRYMAAYLLFLRCSQRLAAGGWAERFLQADSRATAPSPPAPALSFRCKRRRHRSRSVDSQDKEKALKTAHTEQKSQTISPLSLSRRCCNLFFSCFAYVTRAACNGLVALLGLRKGGETALGLCGWPQPPACTREGTRAAWMGQICCQPPGFEGFHFLHPPSVRTPGVAQELWVRLWGRAAAQPSLPHRGEQQGLRAVPASCSRGSVSGQV